MNRTVLLLSGIGVALLATSVFAQPSKPSVPIDPRARPGTPGTPGTGTTTIPEVIVYGGFRDLGNPMTFETAKTYRFRLDDPGTVTPNANNIVEQFEALGFSNVAVTNTNNLDDTWPEVFRANANSRTSFVSATWNLPTRTIPRASIITHAWEV